jgi:hypothetical protein
VRYLPFLFGTNLGDRIGGERWTSISGACPPWRKMCKPARRDAKTTMNPPTDKERSDAQSGCIALSMLCGIILVLMVIGALALPGRW